jgi:hemerythrin-like domain-containing protein
MTSTERAAVTETSTERPVVSEPTEQAQDIFSILKREHAEINSVLNQFKTAKTSDEKQALANEAIYLISKHSAAEEMEFYPFLREKLPHGNETANNCLAEHQTITEDLAKLDKMSVANDPSYEYEFSRIISEFVRHSQKHEEEIVMPRLRASITIAEALAQGKKYLAVKPLAPSRPHPMAPHVPPANFAVNAVTAVSDAVKDSFRFGFFGSHGAKESGGETAKGTEAGTVATLKTESAT